VTKVAQISARKCTKSVWRPGSARITLWGGSLQPSPDLLAGFNSGGRDTGRRKGKTGGNGQLREGAEEGGKGLEGKRDGRGGKKGEKSRPRDYL